MSAYILVFSHPFFAVTDPRAGTIPGVPPGTYTLRVWIEVGTAEPGRDVVPATATTEADFLVGAAHEAALVADNRIFVASALWWW